MAELFKVTRNGQEKFVPAERLDSFISQGWSESGTKRITTEEGERTVSGAEARKRLATGQAEGIVDDATIENAAIEADLQDRYSGDKLQTFGESAANALTFGLADPLLEGISEASEGDAGGVALRQRINPKTALGGAVVGTLTGALAGPSSLARFTPAALGTKAASKIGAAVASRAGRTAGFVAEGIADGAIFGAGGAYADAVINDDPVNAEKIIAAMGSEALYGGALGGGIGVAVGGLGKLGRKLKVEAEAATKAAKATKDEFTKLATNRMVDTMAASTKGLDDLKTPLKRVKQSISKLGTTDKAVAVGMLDDVTGFVQRGGAIPSPDVKDFDELIKRHPMVGKPRGDEQLELLLENTFGPENVGKINESNEFFAKLHASKLAEKAVEAIPVKRASGLLDKAKSMAITGLGGAIGGLPGAGIAMMLKGTTGGTAKISQGIEKFATFAGKQRRGTVPAATTILGKISFDSEAKPAKTRMDQFKARASELKALQENPGKLTERIENQLRTMKAVKPGLSEQLTAVAIQRINFLTQMLPQSDKLSTFGPDRWKPSQTEIDKFARIAQAAEDPYSILDDLNSGKLTQEAVDTVKQLYPGIYQEIQLGIVNRVDDIKKNVDYKGRIQLGILFQVPTDEVLEPGFVQRMQENYALRQQQREQQGGGQYSTPGNLQKSLTNTQTAAQRIEAK